MPNGLQDGENMKTRKKKTPVVVDDPGVTPPEKMEAMREFATAHTVAEVVEADRDIKPAKKRKARKKKVAPTAEYSRVGVRSANLIEVMDLDDLPGLDVKGSYLKLRPQLKPSEKKAIDVFGLREQLLERGAFSVLWAPRIIAESRTKEADAVPVMDPRQAIKDWIARQVGLDESTRERALELTLQLAEEVGI